MKGRHPIRIVPLIALLLSLGLLLSFPLSKWWIHQDAGPRIFDDPELILKQKVGLVLGCAQNLYFYARADAAVKLYKAEKISYLLVSGDNHATHYDEATAMKEVLVNAGIPADKIICDYAGFSTFDSVLRAKKVFGQDSITIISQRFHVERALFIAKRMHIDALGFCALDIETAPDSPTLARERFARIKTILDLYILNRKPVFLGEPVLIGSDDNRSVPLPVSEEA